MMFRSASASASPFAALCLTLLLSGCAGGTRGAPTNDARQCSEAGAFCLTSCSIGCTSGGGCSIGEIAQNQRLRFHFSQPVDPSSVGLDSISLKTSSGTPADGDFVVEDSVVTFIPEVRRVGAQTFFGFAPNDEYLVTLLAGGASPFALRSTSGDTLPRPLTCTVRSTLGIVDLDAQPPRARVVSPSASDDLPSEPTFVLRFSEVVDPSDFAANPSGPDAPVQFFVLQAGDNGSCESEPGRDQRLPGTVFVEEDLVADQSTLTFRPTVMLPPNRCVQARVSARVRDLSGRPATPQVFVFRTPAVVREEFAITEDFSSDDQFDADRSAAKWENGALSFHAVGGDGRHGDFDYERGFYDPNAGEWQVSTDGSWPGDENALVRNDTTFGRYFFSSFIIPEGIRVRFVGSFPARIHVRGTCRIDGELLFGGLDLEGYTVASNGNTNQPGQTGGSGGPGAGRGGNGGRQGDGNSAQNVFHGRDGEDVRVPANHAFAGRVAGTGGRGSRQYPVDGLVANFALTVPGRLSGQAANGGGGGSGPGSNGSPGRVVEVGRFSGAPSSNDRPANPAAAGANFVVGIPPSSSSSSDHYLIGGAGGGGGSHAFYQQDRYIAGAAGAGGGGALRLRIGRSLLLGPNGVIDGRGGSAGRSSSSIGPGIDLAAPGGGGSGGSLLLQLGADDALQLEGSIDVRGGNGGSAAQTGVVFAGEVEGGTGGNGLFRIETPRAPLNPGLWPLDLRPDANASATGVLEESDDLVGAVSRAFDTQLMEAPLYRRYEIEALVDGIPTVFSDDPSIGIAAIEGTALRFYAQGISIDRATGQPSTAAPPSSWVRRVGSRPGSGSLNTSARTGFRWLLVADRNVALQVEVTKVVIVYAR